jgi:adenine phosphoribosyltransferase
MTTSPDTKQFLRSLIRAIPDYPKPGVVFQDITPLLADPEGLRSVTESLRLGVVGFVTRAELDKAVLKVAACEARGFILGAALAAHLGVGFIPLRKKGKLPYNTIGQDYELEYGTDRIEMHVDAIESGDRVILVDDLIATGGTINAALNLLAVSGATVVCAAFLIDLPALGGRARIEARGTPVFAALSY